MWGFVAQQVARQAEELCDAAARPPRGQQCKVQVGAVPQRLLHAIPIIISLN